MDGRQQVTPEVLRGHLVLPPDTRLTPIDQLDPKLRQRLGGEAGDVALTRPFTRQPSKVIDPALAQLVELFREPRTIAQVVARYCRAAGEDAEAVLEAALPLLTELVQTSILLPEGDDRAAVPQPKLRTGDAFGEFEIIQCLQVFADSDVYKARHATGFAALKVCRSPDDPAMAARLAREARVLARLQGAAAPRLLAEGVVAGRRFLAQGWIQGSDVSRAALELREAGDHPGLLRLLHNVARAYAVLEARGVLHGDIHPRNVIAAADGTVHLIDFGLAAVAGEAEPDAERGGVAFFYEPEFAAAVLDQRPAPPATPAGQQFSLAALLFHLATGNYYDDFELERAAMFSAIRDPQPKPFTAQGGPAWPSLEGCLAKALARNPEDRFPTIHDFAAALARCEPPEPAREHPGPAGAGTGPEPAFVRELLAALGPDGQLRRNGIAGGPVCSLNGGAAGLAYGFYRLACGREDPALLAAADLWLSEARRHQDLPAAFRDPEQQIDADLVGPVSVHHGPAGISWAAALLALAVGDLGNAELEIGRYLAETEPACPQRDATLGRCSAILASATLLRSLPETLQPLGEVLAASTRDMLDELWREVAAFARIGGGDWPNLGLAHGWAGLLYTTLRWHRAAGDPLPAGFDDRLAQLRASTHPDGRGLNIPWHLGNGEVTPGMPGWCNGSAGLVHLGCLAYEVTGREDDLAFAEGAAWHSWEAAEGPGDLCCGGAGRAYALLELHRATDDPVWLSRARNLVRRSIDHGPRHRSEEHQPHSLFKGDLGLALLADELTRPETACMPLMGIER